MRLCERIVRFFHNGDLSLDFPRIFRRRANGRLISLLFVRFYYCFVYTVEIFVHDSEGDRE